MLIMRTHMIGVVNSEPYYAKDDSGDDLWCTFSILVKEEGEQMPFTVCVGDKPLLAICREQLVSGCYVLVDGIIGVSFQSIKTRYTTLYPVITSSMKLICKEICIITYKNGKKPKPFKKKMLPSVASTNDMDGAKNLSSDGELPF